MIKVFDKDGRKLAEFNQCFQNGKYYACSTTHRLTYECLVDLGWPTDKCYLKFFEDAYGHDIKPDDVEIINESWPNTSSKIEFENAVTKLTSLPKVSYIKNGDTIYDKPSMPEEAIQMFIETTSDGIKRDDTETKPDYPATGKLLKCGSSVRIITKHTTYYYTCYKCFLSNHAGSNNAVFIDVGIDACKFCEICYGYKPDRGIYSWPETKEVDDYGALYRVLCGIVYTKMGRVYVDGTEIQRMDALKTLSKLQEFSLSELMGIHAICDESSTKSNAPQNYTNIEVSHEIKLTNISCKHKVQL